jgi:hypothetical protein
MSIKDKLKDAIDIFILNLPLLLLIIAVILVIFVMMDIVANPTLCPHCGEPLW